MKAVWLLVLLPTLGFAATVPGLSQGGTNNSTWTSAARKCVTVDSTGLKLEAAGGGCSTVVNAADYVDCTGATVSDSTLATALTAATGGTLFIPKNCTILVQGPASTNNCFFSSATCGFEIPTGTSIIGESKDTSLIKLAGKSCTGATGTTTNGAACTTSAECRGTSPTCAFDGNASQIFANGNTVSLFYGSGSSTQQYNFQNFSINARGLDAFSRCSTGSPPVACSTATGCTSGSCTAEPGSPVGSGNIKLFDRFLINNNWNIQNVNIYDHRKGTFDVSTGSYSIISGLDSTRTFITQVAPAIAPYYAVDNAVIIASGTTGTVVENNTLRGSVTVVDAGGSYHKLAKNTISVLAASATSVARPVGIRLAGVANIATDNNVLCSNTTSSIGSYATGILITGSSTSQDVIVSHNNVNGCFNGIKTDCATGNLTIDHNRIKFGVGTKIQFCSYGNFVRGNYLAWDTGSISGTPKGKTCKGGTSDREICSVDGDCTGSGATCEIEPVIRAGYDGRIASGAAHAGVTGNIIHSDQGNVSGIRFADLDQRCSVVGTGTGNTQYARCTVSLCSSGACTNNICTTGGAACCGPSGGSGTCTTFSHVDTKIAENQFYLTAGGTTYGVDASLPSNNTGLDDVSIDENHFLGSDISPAYKIDVGIYLPSTTTKVANNYFSNNFCSVTRLCVKNFQRAMGVAKDNLPSQSENSILDERRQWVVQQRDQIGSGSPTFDSVGIDSTVNVSTGTATDLVDTTGNYVSLATGAVASNEAKWLSGRFTLVRTDQAPIFSAVIKTGTLGTVNSAASSRTIVGLTSADPLASAASHGLYFRYDTAADSTAAWRIVSNNGSAYASANIQTTSIAIADNTRYVLRIVFDGVTARYYINGELAGTSTTTLPTSTQAMGYIVGMRTLTGATNRSLNISKISLEHN